MFLFIRMCCCRKSCAWLVWFTSLTILHIYLVPICVLFVRTPLIALMSLIDTAEGLGRIGLHKYLSRVPRLKISCGY